MTSSLDKLVDDILIRIFQVLSVHTILSLRQTSRRYYLLSKLRCVWYARFYAEVLARNLPQPGPARPLPLLSAAELEQRTLRALHLDQAWPRLSACLLVSKNHPYGERVDQVVFIPGGAEVLTVHGDKVVHWLVVSWPGLAQGLKYVGECTPFAGVPCRVVKDGDVPGVIAVGPRKPSSSQRFVKVFSTSLKAPFVTLCHYTRVLGVLVGVWRHLLLLDMGREPGFGGIELLDWHAQTTGTAILPRLLDPFGDFLDFVVFADHLLVVWEYCVSVFPVPHVPADDQVVVEHKRVFMFQEAVCRPVGFTTCVARSQIPDANLDQVADWDMGSSWDGRHEPPSPSAQGMPSTLTIVARSRRRTDTLSMVMLIPLVDEGRGKAMIGYPNTFPYRLAYLPPHLANPSWEDGEGIGGGAGYRLPACMMLRLGWSGRGVLVVGRELRLVSPGLHILPPYDMQLGPVFETGDALYHVDTRQRRDSSWLHLNRIVGGDAEEWVGSGDKVDFDEGTGRIVVAKERGGFEVVQLD